MFVLKWHERGRVNNSLSDISGNSRVEWSECDRKFRRCQKYLKAYTLIIHPSAKLYSGDKEDKSRMIDLAKTVSCHAVISCQAAAVPMISRGQLFRLQTENSWRLDLTRQWHERSPFRTNGSHLYLRSFSRGHTTSVFTVFKPRFACFRATLKCPRLGIETVAQDTETLGRKTQDGALNRRQIASVGQ